MKPTLICLLAAGALSLGAGRWKLHAFAGHPEQISDTPREVSASDTLELSLAPAGGYAAALSTP